MKILGLRADAARSASSQDLVSEFLRLFATHQLEHAADLLHPDLIVFGRPRDPREWTCSMERRHVRATISHTFLTQVSTFALENLSPAISDEVFDGPLTDSAAVLLYDLTLDEARFTVGFVVEAGASAPRAILRIFDCSALRAHFAPTVEQKSPTRPRG